MTFFRVARAAALAGVAGLLALSLSPPALRAAEDDPVVAKVDGFEIHRSDVMEIVQGLPQQYRQMPLETLFPVLRDRLIELQLVAAEGRKANLADDEVVKRRMRKIEDRVIRDVYLSRYVDKKVTDETLRKMYEDEIANTPPKVEVRARHILVKTEAEAKALIARIKAGEDFATLAKENSIGPSGAKGGDLGYFTHDAMVPAFADAAFALDVGAVTDAPVQTQFGWHVIKVEDRREAPPPSFEDSRERLRAQASQTVVRALLDELRGKAAIERFNLDGTPAPAE